MAIMTVDAYTDGLVNETEEKYYESGQPFRVEEIFDLGRIQVASAQDEQRGGKWTHAAVRRLR